MTVTPYRLISLIISISLITSDTELLFICFAVVVGGGVFGHLYVLLWRGPDPQTPADWPSISKGNRGGPGAFHEGTSRAPHMRMGREGGLPSENEGVCRGGVPIPVNAAEGQSLLPS